MPTGRAASSATASASHRRWKCCAQVAATVSRVAGAFVFGDREPLPDSHHQIAPPCRQLWPDAAETCACWAGSEYTQLWSRRALRCAATTYTLGRLGATQMSQAAT